MKDSSKMHVSYRGTQPIETVKEVDDVLLHCVEKPPIKFSLREIEILHLVAEGKTSYEIAALLNLQTDTIESHRKRMIKKIRAKNLYSVLAYTITNNILTRELLVNAFSV